MHIGIVTPAPPNSRFGNRVTALRWASILRRIGHTVTITETYRDERFDLLVGLHAFRSYASINSFHRAHSDRPIVVALTGTDIYRDLKRSKRAQRSLDLATRIVVLQPKALEVLPSRWREKTRVIYQSVEADGRLSAAQASSRSRRRRFEVCVVGHLRPVKDPFRAAMAARLLPASSRISIIQVGGAMSVQQELRARAEMKRNPRYRWLGDRSPAYVRRIMKRCQLFVLSSRLEGGANVLGEAIVAGVPVLASRIPGSVGILGESYPGYFEPGETRELSKLMSVAEADPAFLRELKQACDQLARLFDPAREREAWGKLLDEIER